MKKHKNNLKLDAWDFIPGKSPVGDMASVNIPKKNIIWLAHSGSGRLDIGLAGGVVHLLQRDSEKTVATSEEIARSRFNKVGCAYWIAENLGDVYDQFLKGRKLEKRMVIDEKIPKKLGDSKIDRSSKITKEKIVRVIKQHYTGEDKKRLLNDVENDPGFVKNLQKLKDPKNIPDMIELLAI